MAGKRKRYRPSDPMLITSHRIRRSVNESIKLCAKKAGITTGEVIALAMSKVPGDLHYRKLVKAQARRDALLDGAMRNFDRLLVAKKLPLKRP